MANKIWWDIRTKQWIEAEPESKDIFERMDGTLRYAVRARSPQGELMTKFVEYADWLRYNCPATSALAKASE